MAAFDKWERDVSFDPTDVGAFWIGRSARRRFEQAREWSMLAGIELYCPKKTPESRLFGWEFVRRLHVSRPLHVIA